MAIQAAVAIPQAAIAEFCERHHIRKLALFGSVLRDDFRPDSDIDVLVDFEPGTRYRFADLLTMEAELEAIFRRKVDLGDYKAVQEDPNYIRRKHILGSAQVVYENG